ncbi:MAG: hypothetical protein K2G45_06420 [Lachnospiraceae bacterium]|nr:hypothetical protein [Lachnospiraceae bacterium]
MEKQKAKNGTGMKGIIIAIFMVAIVLFYFNYLSNNSSKKKTERQLDELQQLCEYDMLGNYPKTPRDVVKMHCRYLKVFYGQDLNDDELYTLNQQVRNLYSSELLSYNSETDTLRNLKQNIEKMTDEGYVYKTYVLPEASQIKFYTQNGVEMATLEVEITVDVKKDKGYIYAQYVLVKENEQWKILAWGDSRFGEGSAQVN